MHHMCSDAKAKLEVRNSLKNVPEAVSVHKMAAGYCLSMIARFVGYGMQTGVSLRRALFWEGVSGSGRIPLGVSGVYQCSKHADFR